MEYRKDIEGLRGWAVIFVFIFHLGYFHSGYLGVDIFFVISGFLITNIIFKEIKGNIFTFTAFYLRRARRILPLTLCVTIVSLVVGVFTMLPDDLENLAESVVATNFFSNNILSVLIITDYWDVRNEYKPLMHTWSLGVEEQFYFIYPMLLYVIFKYRKGKYVFFYLLSLLLASLLLNIFLKTNSFNKFYLLQYRYWELAAGGLIAVWGCSLNPWGRRIGCLLLLSGFYFDSGAIMDQILVVSGACLLMCPSDKKEIDLSIILRNPVIVYIGGISFSLYMWHQVILAFHRYAYDQKQTWLEILMLVLSTLSLSVLSYNFIEQPFRKKGNIKTLHLLAILFIGTLTSSLYGLYIYQKAGVLRDVPELNAYIGNTQRGQHALYNSRGYKLDNPFVSSSKKKVLIVGNSQGRDWINVLLESRFSDKIEVSYLSNVDDLKKEVHRINVADVVFFDSPKPSTPEEYGIPRSKFWAIGCKNFGASNGYFFNYRGDDYYMQRVEISKQILDLHLELKHQWKNRYMNYLDKVIDANNKVPVFTPDKKFISQDCRHLTQAGAIFFAKLFEGDLARVFEDEQIIKGK